MKLFLIDYDRRAGKIVEMLTYDATAQRREAYDARFKRELAIFRQDIDREVVLLEAIDEAAPPENAQQILCLVHGTCTLGWQRKGKIRLRPKVIESHMNITIISCSLSPDSRSRVLANAAAGLLRSNEATVQLLDLREHPLPMCDGEGCDERAIAPLRAAIQRCGCDPAGRANLQLRRERGREESHRADRQGLGRKARRVPSAAGGHGSYMSIMGLVNSLMLDFRCLVVPRFVYAVGNDFAGDEISSAKIRDRVQQLCSETSRIAMAMKNN